MALYRRVKTPCLGICSTGVGDSVCRGCKRFAHEVIDWNHYSNNQKQIIANRLEGFIAQIVSNYIEVVDERLLLVSIKYQQIAFNEDQPIYCWVFDLLRAGASQISDITVFGLRVRASAALMSFTQIRRSIEQDYLALSEAHYERYIAPGMPKQG